MIQTPTLRQLEYLVAIADLGSFHRAARACGVSQPGLSAQVRQLETLLELRLLERDRRRVLLTPAGVELVRRARAVLAEAQGLVEVARAFQRPLCGTLRLGVIPTVAPYLLPRVLPRVRKRHPELRLRLREAQTGELVAALDRGELDVLLLLLDDGHCLRAQALAVCREAGAEEQSDFRATSLGTLIEMVCGGAGVTLLPELSLRSEARRAGLAVVPFAKPEPHRTIGLAWRPSSGRAAEFALLAASIGSD